MILSVIQTNEFKSEFISDAIFDTDRGILGWKESSEIEENVSYTLHGKVAVEIKTKTVGCSFQNIQVQE